VYPRAINVVLVAFAQSTWQAIVVAFFTKNKFFDPSLTSSTQGT
jgi:hypothetical protein